MDDPAFIMLEIWTEFLDPVNPQRTPAIMEREPDAAQRAALVEPDLVDETLDLGAMMIPLGAAFLTEEEFGTDADWRAPVYKNWVITEGGRRFLVERVRYLEVKERLDRLPPAGAAVAPRRRDRELARAPARGGKQILRSFPGQLAGRPPNEPGTAVRMAMASRPETGFTIDYNLVGPLTNFVFKAGETYWLSSNATVNFWGITRLEGGSVVKFSSNSVNRLLINGALECLTGEYAPMFFVAKDDDTVGSIISGSTGQPGYTYYVSRALELNSASDVYDLKHLRFRNTDKPIVLKAGTLAVSCGAKSILREKVVGIG